MTISPSPSACCWSSRRAFARTSSTDRSDESSMNSGDFASRLEASMILPQRDAGTLPLRRSSPLIEACEAMKRCASSDSDISSENSATALLPASAAFSAKLAISADLPHRRAGREDDQVAGLEAAGDACRGRRSPTACR